MSENTQNQNPKQEQYSLNDDRRVKVLSPGALVAKRFFRNRLAVVGLSILVAMFLFSFVGGLVSPYGQDEQFFTYTQMSKEFVGVTRNDSMRFVVADGQNFGSIAQSKALEAVKKGNTEFNYKDVDYTVDIQSDDFYVVYQGRDIMGYASRDLVNEADGAPKFSFDVKLAALTAMTAGEKEFAADGVDYTLDADGNILAGGEELGYVSRFVVSAADSSVVVTRDFKDRLEEAIDDNAAKFNYTDAEGNEYTIKSAKGVLLACGGYENNLEMQRDFHGMDEVYTAGTPGNTGDGIKMLMEAGAKIWHMKNQTQSGGFWLGIKVPEYESTFMRNFDMPGNSWIEVASDNTRFYNCLLYTSPSPRDRG